MPADESPAEVLASMSLRPASRARRLGAALTVVALLIGARGEPTIADPGLTISTPYPSVAAQPGSTVEFDVSVTAGITEPVELEVADVPDGWSTVLRGGGFVVQSVTASPNAPGEVTLEVTVPPDAE